MSNFHFDLLPINGLTVQVLTGDFGVPLVGHGHEGVTLAGVEDVGDTPTFGEFGLQKVFGTRAINSVDKNLNAVVRHFGGKYLEKNKTKIFKKK
jgi:hypothetical protein